MKKLLFILIPFMLLSCAIRKTSNSKTEKASTLERTVESVDITKSEAQTDVKTHQNIQTVINNNLVDASEKLEPIDPTKPIEKTEEYKDGKLITTWNNAKVDASRKTDTSTSSKNEIKEESTFDKKKTPK